MYGEKIRAPYKACQFTFHLAVIFMTYTKFYETSILNEIFI